MQIRSEDSPTESQLCELNDNQIDLLWQEFGDVPINDLDEIEGRFLNWVAGTNRFVIWKWFDQNHSKGVAYLTGK
ncbi:hypothetical protein [Paenibacillus agricola]|uniref:Uncharacterized protein n=1 Tax=Paenibacillus agricola TaxID=2716264 RepID=A0ABX0JLD0_9BACL|nr:hypothetical protein [Paenibacillus agricola]NHN35514.1 hypothetical protein [Paenibacillus agricola]